jgi:hypothetical protein
MRKSSSQWVARQSEQAWLAASMHCAMQFAMVHATAPPKQLAQAALRPMAVETQAPAHVPGAGSAMH